MPPRPLRPCKHRGCRALVPGGMSYCEEHAGEDVGWKPDSVRGNRHARGYGSRWEKLREMVLLRDGGICRCAECRQLGRVRLATEVDHVIPKAQDGTDDPENLSAINHDCHKAKTARERRQGAAPRRRETGS
ncbi:HNH endonuclease [Paraburkholderia unamae]|uniref:5-methylcytosine-specific restriction protein A n=1 Tax=Paraburkholderia unamae TaxID=219649 RepID=A0ABX5KXG2_9BURK|nr:HNH endonuclease [Paraburkholderia unamae]PVX86467.1 5-methylcytosine-specific restriction protein A [Paraburkholderia unamae]